MTKSLNIQRKDSLSVGAVSLPWVFSATTTATPAAGGLRLNHATPASATSLFVSETAKFGIAAASLLALIVKGSRVTVSAANKPGSIIIFNVVSNTDNGADRTLVVTVAYNAGTFAEGDLVNLTVENVTLPAKPADSGTFTLKCVNGVLTWVSDT